MGSCSSTLGTSLSRANVCSFPVLIGDRNGEVVNVAQHTVHHFARRCSDRGSDGGAIINGAGRTAGTVTLLARHHDFLLKINRVIFSRDMGQVSRNGMAACATTRAVEIGLPRLRVAHQDVENFVGAALGGGANAIVQEGDDIGNLIGREGELGHAFIGATVQNYFADEVSVLVMQDRERAKQVGAAFTAFGVSAMAKGAVRRVSLFTALKRGFVIGFIVKTRTPAAASWGWRCLGSGGSSGRWPAGACAQMGGTSPQSKTMATRAGFTKWIKLKSPRKITKRVYRDCLRQPADERR